MTPGGRSPATRVRLAHRGAVSFMATLAVSMAGVAAQAQVVPPGLRPSPSRPDPLRPLNFIAIPFSPGPLASAPSASLPTALPSPRTARAPRPVLVADTEGEALVGLPIRRAVIHHRGGAAVVGAMRAAGHLRLLADTIELRVVADVPALPSIRYFYEEDAGAAQVTAIALEESGRFQVRGFPDYRPRPRPGLIEVWLPIP